MILSTLNLSQLVSNAAAAMQAASNKLVNLTVGSVLRAILDASASVQLWIQWLVILVLQATRLSTSTGGDVDTFVNDFSLTREAATFATGQVTFSRFTSTTTALIVPYFNADGTINTAGVQALTADGTQAFGVTTNTSHSLWNVALGGYLVPVSTASATVEVQALVSGTGGNVQAAAITGIGTAVPNIDTVTNVLAFADAVDAETDVALKARFTNYINSLSRAIPLAIETAIEGVQQGLSYSLADNQDTLGNYKPGNFVVTVDDGSGTPPSSLLTSIFTAVDAVTGFTITFSVQAPIITSVAISLVITVGPGGVKANLIGPVATAITKYVNSLPVGATLPYTQLAAIAYQQSQYITNVTSLLVNGATADITVPTTGIYGVVKASSVAVS